MFMQNNNQNNYSSPSAINQISSMIERYNQLIEEINKLEDLHKIKEIEIKTLKTESETEFILLREKIFEITKLVEQATKYKTIVGSEFKQIIKVDSFNKLKRRIDVLDFENKISRSEFNHIIER
ncbi:MAG: hypothetical protein WC758_01210 [Candidatus Woesearchaeota archaeon]|jgi:hypothetical protein